MAVGDPVILVPGFLGSELRLRTWTRHTAGLWLSPPALLAGGFPLLRLPSPYAPATDPTKELQLGGPLGGYYGLLAEFLRDFGWSVSSPLADWRRPAAEDAARLVEEIRRVTRTAQKCLIVCHSRGGLVTRRALAILAQTGDVGLVGRVVGLGVPHTGSMEGVANIASNGDIQESLFKLGYFGVRYLGHGLGLEQVYAVMKSWPALYELLPDPDRSWLPAEIRAAVYNPATYASVPRQPEAAYLGLAAANWRSLPLPPDGVDWIDVAGVGLETTFTVENAAQLVERGAMTLTLDGDGTVPLVSAAQSPRRRVTAPCEHGLLPQDGRVMAVVERALRQGLREDVVITGDLLSR